MIYRFFVALTFTVVVFPFAAMYTFAAVYPEAHFAFDRQTWLQGLFPIAVGWTLFLLPGIEGISCLIPCPGRTPVRAAPSRSRKPPRPTSNCRRSKTGIRSNRRSKPVTPANLRKTVPARYPASVTARPTC